mgnify:CR=1 FL=1
MLTGLYRLGLEVTDLDAARAFYEDRLGFVPVDTPDRVPDADPGSSVAYAVGSGDDAGATLRFRRPTDIPRGGVHTHYAFSTTRAAYAQWWRRLADLDPVEFSFGAVDSPYVPDPARSSALISGFRRGDPAARAAPAHPPRLPAAPDADAAATLRGAPGAPRALARPDAPRPAGRCGRDDVGSWRYALSLGRGSSLRPRVVSSGTT